jgi:hypothetical protein
LKLKRATALGRQGNAFHFALDGVLHGSFIAYSQRTVMSSKMTILTTAKDRAGPARQWLSSWDNPISIMPDKNANRLALFRDHVFDQRGRRFADSCRLKKFWAAREGPKKTKGKSLSLRGLRGLRAKYTAPHPRVVS